MTRPRRQPDRDDPTTPPERRGWWLALLAIPVLCYAGPILLTTLGVGSVGALVAAGTGRFVLAAAGPAVAATALWRRGVVGSSLIATPAPMASSPAEAG